LFWAWYRWRLKAPPFNLTDLVLILLFTSDQRQNVRIGLEVCEHYAGARLAGCEAPEDTKWVQFNREFDRLQLGRR
jgi:hypothetical protein